MHVTCSCGKTLRVRDDPLAKRVRCPACKAIFTVDPAEQLPDEAAIQAGHPHHFAVQEDFHDEEHGDAWREADYLHDSSNSNALVWILGIAGAAVLLIGAGVAAFFLLMHAPAADDVAVVAQPMPARPIVPQKPIIIEEVDLAPRGKEPKQVPFAAAPAKLADVNWVNNLAYAPDGKQLATVQNFGNGLAHYVLQVWDTSSGKQRFKLHEGNDSAELVAFSADSEFLACFCFHSSLVKVWSMKDGKLLKTFKSPRNETFQDRLLAFSPDNRSVMVASDDRIFRLDFMSGKTIDLERIGITSNHRMACLTTSPHIALGGVDLQLVDQADGSWRAVAPLTGTANAITCSHDGKTLAVAYVQGHIDVFDTTTWQLKTTLRREKSEAFQYYYDLQFSRDGKLLACKPQFHIPRAKLRNTGRLEMWDIADRRMKKLDMEDFYKYALAPDVRNVAIAVLRGKLVISAIE